MKRRIFAPRLLTATIGLLAVVLAARAVTLIHSIIVHGQPSTMITAAFASGPAPAPPEKPAPKAAIRAVLKPTYINFCLMVLPPTCERIPPSVAVLGVKIPS